MQCLVIIPAAGTGARFGAALPKQFLLLRDRPLLAHVVERFLSEDHVAGVIVCASPDQTGRIEAMKKERNWTRVSVTHGGATRQESVLRGLMFAERDPQDLVAIHDAVRPFFRSEVFQATLRAADEHGAAVPVIPLNDTIHRVKDGFVFETPDRSEMFAAQTPQCFRASILRRALEEAMARRYDATDEAAAVTRTGIAVRTVPGDSTNIKITREEDLALAEANFDRWSGR